MWITGKGQVFSGEQPPGSQFIKDRPSPSHTLKANWQGSIPDVWEFDIAAARQPAIDALFLACTKKLNEVLSYYPKGEEVTWGDKAPLAVQWLSLSASEKTAAKTNLTYVTLFKEATNKCRLTTAGDVTAVTELCGRIAGNKTIFGAFAGAVLNVKTTTLSAINAATTAEAIAAITWDFDAITYESIVEELDL